MLHKIIIALLTVIIIIRIIYFVDIIQTELNMPSIPVFTQQEMEQICILESI